MMRGKLLICGFYLFNSGLLLSQTFWGQNQYIEYREGVLPIVISVPHGGALEPSGIPDRTCNNAVTVTDANTIDLALKIDSALYAQTNCHAHLVICHLKRTKLDCNRNLSDGACGNGEAMTAWNEFHDFIEQAQATALTQHGERVFYIDLHGHGNPVQRIELGYLLYEDELELSDATLNASQYVGYSSIQNLVSTNLSGYSHSELLRGEFALGTLLANNGYPSVPSQQDPFPGIGSNYFSGGYNTLNHSSYATGNPVDGVQMECNYNGVRDTDVNRSTFAGALSAVMNEYLEVHHGVSIGNGGCGIGGLYETEPETNAESVLLSTDGIAEYLSRYDGQEWNLYSCSGKLVLTSSTNGSPILLESGTYFMQLNDSEGQISSIRLILTR